MTTFGAPFSLLRPICKLVSNGKESPPLSKRLVSGITQSVSCAPSARRCGGKQASPQSYKTLARPQRATASPLRMVSRPFQVEVRRSEAWARAECNPTPAPGCRQDAGWLMRARCPRSPSDRRTARNPTFHNAWRAKAHGDSFPGSSLGTRLSWRLQPPVFRRCAVLLEARKEAGASGITAFPGRSLGTSPRCRSPHLMKTRRCFGGRR